MLTTARDAGRLSEGLFMAQPGPSAATGFRSAYRRIADLRGRMSVYRCIPDLAPKGAEGRHMTQGVPIDPQTTLASEGAKATVQSRADVSMRGPSAAVSLGCHLCVLRKGNEGDSPRDWGGVDAMHSYPARRYHHEWDKSVRVSWKRRWRIPPRRHDHTSRKALFSFVEFRVGL